MARIQLDLDDKPHLSKAIRENKKLALEVMQTFVEMMEHAFQYGWANLPQQFHQDLTFKGMIHDILHGVLDLKDIDPKYYSDLGAMVHPFGLFSWPIPDPMQPEKTYYYDWQRHFDISKDDPAPIQTILRKLLYYARYIEISQFGEAVFRKNLDVYFAERDPSSIMMVQPAIVYQRNKMGEHITGKITEKYGLFDCGPWPEEAGEGCPACTVGEIIDLPGWKACKRCGAGFRTKAVDTSG